MITAMPDIQTLAITEEVEFVVLACDGDMVRILFCSKCTYLLCLYFKLPSQALLLV